MLPRHHIRIALVLLPWLLSACGGSSSASRPVSAALGAPTSDIPPPDSPSYGFRPGFPLLRSGNKVELLLLDANWDPASAVDRWPIVKALDQFGSWRGLTSGVSQFAAIPHGQLATRLPSYGAVPTFEFTNATYHSRFVVFVHQLVQPTPASPLRRLPPPQEALFLRALNEPQAVPTFKPYRLPVVIVGGYGMHGPIEEPVTVGAPPAPSSKVLSQPFGVLDKDMRQGDEAPDIGYIIREMNADTNTVTALICHADGMRPAAACNRPVIRIMVGHLKG